MDGTSLVRLRWRLRGAWMWPSFVVLTLVDGLIVSRLPPLGDSGSFVGGWLVGLSASLICIVVLGPPLAMLLRRMRTDLPRTVARDYVGTVTTLAVTAALLTAGVVHHRVVTADAAALEDATARAEAYIGEYAPARFQAHLRDLDTYELQPPVVYRVCDELPFSSSAYCVVVDRDRPFGDSVRYDGAESNALLSQGAS